MTEKEYIKRTQSIVRLLEWVGWSDAAHVRDKKDISELKRRIQVMLRSFKRHMKRLRKIEEELEINKKIK